MTAQELAIKQIRASADMFDRSIAGLSPAEFDQRVNEHTMSAREMVAHLTECCLAVQEGLAGQAHQWGSYSAGDRTPEELLAELAAERQKAWDQLAAAEGDKPLEMGMDYLALHDAYHVGQMVTLRLTLDPSWNSYSIYAGHA